jgi:hypothetical protein
MNAISLTPAGKAIARLREIASALPTMTNAEKIEAGKEADALLTAVIDQQAMGNMLASQATLLTMAKVEGDDFMANHRINGRSSKERLAKALAEHAVRGMTDLQAAHTAVKAVVTVAYSDVSARKDAVTVLENWADEKFGRFVVSSNADSTMVAAFKAVLVRMGKAFLSEREAKGEDIALAAILRWAMSRTLGAENNVEHVYQIRVSDLGMHLAENAAHQFIVRALAHGVLGTEQAQHLGIQREYNL